MKCGVIQALTFISRLSAPRHTNHLLVAPPADHSAGAMGSPSAPPSRSPSPSPPYTSTAGSIAVGATFAFLGEMNLPPPDEEVEEDDEEGALPPSAPSSAAIWRTTLRGKPVCSRMPRATSTRSAWARALRSRSLSRAALAASWQAGRGG